MSAAVVRVPSGLSVDGWSAASYRGLWEVKKRFLPQCAARDDAPFKFRPSSILSILRYMMNYRILSRITALVGALMVFAALATSAHAATVPPAAAKLAAEKAVVAKVATAANPQAAFQSLSPSEQALFADSLTHLTVTTIASGGRALPAPAGAANPCACVRS